MDLAGVVRRAILISDIDFAVVEGIRTLSRQKELVASRASQTMHSRHLTGDAVDLAPYVGKSISWHLQTFYPLAAAMKQAASEAGVRIVWGGCWDMTMDQYDDPEQAVAGYTDRRGALGFSPFIDAPHFELVKPGP